MRGFFVKSYLFVLLFILPIPAPAFGAELHLVYATDADGPYARIGVPLSVTSALRHASCPVIVHHYTTAQFPHLCADRYLMPYSVHGSASYLSEAACAAWVRIFAAPHIPYDGWALYLDADTIVLGDLCPLIDSLPDKGYLAMRTMDHYVLRHKDFFNATQLWKMGVDRFHRRGFNNGVFAYHAARWREANATMRMWQWQIEAHRRLGQPYPLFHYNDMAVMTLVGLQDGVIALDERFNCMHDGVPECVVRHMMGKHKPWDMTASELHAYNAMPWTG